MRRLLACAVSLSLGVSGLASADPVGSRDPVTFTQQIPKRFLASSPGSSETIAAAYGPFVIPPGSDLTRVAVDVQLPIGFLTKVEVSLVDMTSGRVPLEQLAHISHADWYRVTDDPEAPTTTVSDELQALRQVMLDRLAYAPAGLQWVFGTGKEGTVLDLERAASVEDADADGVPDRSYGIQVGTQPLGAVVQVANESLTPLEVFVVFDAEIVHGTDEQLLAITGRPWHDLIGFRWTNSADAVQDAGRIVATFDAPTAGTLVAASAHLHPGAEGATLVNLGPFGKCTSDVDTDGLPGRTLLRMPKIDHVAELWPYSNDYQVAMSKAGWRTPIRSGDRLALIADHDVMDGRDPVPPPGHPILVTPGSDTMDGEPHAWFGAAATGGILLDQVQVPPLYPPAIGCPSGFVKLSAPRLLGADEASVQQRLGFDAFGISPHFAPGVSNGMQSAPWRGLEGNCGHPDTPGYRGDCDGASGAGDPVDSDTMTIAGTFFIPGDRVTGQSIRVPRGTDLKIANLDPMTHAVSTCRWPCDGPALANHPLSDGVADSGLVGPGDVFREGKTCAECVESQAGLLPTSRLAPGEYSFYCRIHPFMRGTLIVGQEEAASASKVLGP